MTEIYSDALYGAGLYSAVDDAVAHRITAWSFVLGGHLFYAITLGIEGTLVCDPASENAWYEWAYFGSVGFPAREGCDVEDLYLLGSKEDGQIYNLDPAYFTDDENLIESYTTAVFPVRGTTQIPCYEFVVNGTLSGVELSGAILLTSDDYNQTWDAHDFIATDFPIGEFSWRSLGSMNAPARLFQVYDTGAFTQINTFFMDTTGAR